jgi:glycosyltransferase involved in cell wall biosynthesis
MVRCNFDAKLAPRFFSTLMNPKTKILIAIDWYRPAHKAGGPITSIENLVNLLGDEENLEFYIVCGLFDYGAKEPLPVEQETWVKVGKAQVQYWHPKRLNLNTWKQLIQQLKPDVVHMQGLWSIKFSILPLMAAQSCREVSHIDKIIVSPRGMLTPQALKQKQWLKAPVAWILKRLNAYKNVIFHSTNDQETKEIAIYLDGGANWIDNNPSSTIPQSLGSAKNPIHQMPNVPRSLYIENREYTKTTNHLNWVFVGRISPEKNPMLLLQALQMLDSPTTGYFIGGYQNEPYFTEFQNAISGLPAQHQVKYLGELGVDEIAEHLTQCDLLINASISENFGHAMAEALSAGVPILVGPNTPWQDLWEAKAGEVAEYSPQGFAAAMDKFAIMDSATHSQFKMGAIQHFAERCELSATKAKYLNLYLFPNP